MKYVLMLMAVGGGVTLLVKPQWRAACWRETRKQRTWLLQQLLWHGAKWFFPHALLLA